MYTCVERDLRLATKEKKNLDLYPTIHTATSSELYTIPRLIFHMMLLRSDL